MSSSVCDAVWQPWRAGRRMHALGRRRDSLAAAMQRKLKSIMDETQQLLPLLTVSVASAADVSTAVAELGSRAAALQGAAADDGAHLRHVAAAVQLLAQRSATALEVQQSMTTLRDSMLLMHEQSMEKVRARVLRGGSACPAAGHRFPQLRQ